MGEIEALIYRTLEDENFVAGVLSNPRNKSERQARKINIEPVLIRDDIKIQLEYEYENKVYHENLDLDQAQEKIYRLLYMDYRQLNIFSLKEDLQIMVSKKKKFRLTRTEASRKERNLDHNRKKNYILEEGIPHDFLVHLGVMNKQGQVIPKMYDKFRQINRFLELVEDSLLDLDTSSTINIVDFGCGKSYLTFGLYYYLVKIRQLDVNIIGLDLKEDVIKFCNRVSEELDYSELKFIHGDIRDFELAENIDMVVTLHACDIATDAALVKAIGWKAKLILSVPCCQSEFYSKIDNKDLEPMLKHGFIKEKLASLVTDSLRALVLESLNYRVQLVEFIDMEHTPKNTLIRANLKGQPGLLTSEDYNKFKDFWSLEDLFIEEELRKIGIDL